MSPFIHLLVIGIKGCSIAAWRDHGHGASFIECLAQPVRIKGLVGQQGIENNAFDKRLHAHDVIALARLQNKPDQIAQGIDKRDNFCCQAAFRSSDGLMQSPPLAPVAFW